MSAAGVHKQSIRLTKRQKTCLRLIAQGMTTLAIAHRLGISVRMVRWHLQRARDCLGAVSLAQAIHHASKLGWLDERQDEK